jgi:hypothetical protein
VSFDKFLLADLPEIRDSDLVVVLLYVVAYVWRLLFIQFDIVSAFLQVQLQALLTVWYRYIDTRSCRSSRSIIRFERNLVDHVPL